MQAALLTIAAILLIDLMASPLNINVKIVLIVINLAVSCVYLFDKLQSIRHRYRIPEKVLLCLTVLSGGVGGVLGIVVANHKTRKNYFTLVALLSMISALIFLGLAT